SSYHSLHFSGSASMHSSFFLRTVFFFFNATATTEFYTLSLHDALPISGELDREQVHGLVARQEPVRVGRAPADHDAGGQRHGCRSEEHTSELQSRGHLVCRLLPEKKKSGLTRHRSRN